VGGLQNWQELHHRKWSCSPQLCTLEAEFISFARLLSVFPNSARFLSFLYH
jgi:hypothetical protein